MTYTITPDPEAPPPEIPPAPSSLPFRRPADYYSSGLEGVRPLFPSWVPMGCGAAALIALVSLFGLGVLASGGGGGMLFEKMFGSMQDEVDGMFASDVTAPEKAAFDGEMKTLRGELKQSRVRMDQIQPLLRSIRDVISDSKVTSKEARSLTEEIREINRKASARSGK